MFSDALLAPGSLLLYVRSAGVLGPGLSSLGVHWLLLWVQKAGKTFIKNNL